jgi:alkaline phosphatase D
VQSTRRQFVTSAGAFAAAAVFAPQTIAEGLTTMRRAPKAHGGKFTDGLMSGDVTPNGVTLWSRIDGIEGAASVELEIAGDASFRHVIARQHIATNKALNHSLKARVEKLKPHAEYFYRFASGSTDSPVGRFRTALPADSQQPVNFAYWSCQDYTHGWYNAHQVMAKGDYDFVVCLGDYIYAETYHSIADGTGVRNDPIGTAPPTELRTDHIREAITYQNYLDKYSLYRTDEHLRAVHQNFATIMLWDDHEVQDNYAGAEPDGGLPPDKRYTTARKKAGYKAYFNSMPSYASPTAPERQYRTLSFGKTVDLIVMDQRQYRDNQPCDDAVEVPCATWDEPRAFLGQPQMKYVQGQLKQSTAAWKVMANEVMIMPTEVLGGAFYTFDSWQGYPQEREQLLTYIGDNKISDVVFITGDIHTFITGDVKTAMGTGATVALEFVGGSITSQGLGEINLPAGGGVVIPGNDKHPNTSPAVLSALKSANPWVKSADTDHHGFAEVKASTSTFDVKLVRMDTIKAKSTAVMPDSPDFHFKVARGQTSILS